MFDEADERNIPIISLGVPEPGLFLKSAETYQQLANEKDLPIELKLLPDIIGDISLKADIAHSNAKGYRKLAEGITEILQKHHFITN